ncbi:reverse transcriptase domain-containing protein [Tanacetum coccineum]
MILKAELNDDETWYADYVNYIVGKIVPPKWTPEKRRRFFSQLKNYFWDEPYVFRLCPNNVMRRCVAGSKILEILAHCHSGPTGGHYSASITGRKVYKFGFFWPSIFKDARDYVMRCDACQRSGNISSKRNKYILVTVDYVSKWVEAQALPANDARVVIKFLRRLFARFEAPFGGVTVITKSDLEDMGGLKTCSVTFSPLVRLTDPDKVDSCTFMVDPSVAFSVDDSIKFISLVPLVDALLLSNPRPFLQLDDF